MTEPTSPRDKKAVTSEGGGTDLVQRQREELRAFFLEKLAVIAEKCRTRGVHFLPDAGRESTYVDYPDTTPELVNASECITEKYLRELWEKEGLVELAEIAGDLMALRNRLRTADRDDEGDVSPFIYAMF